MSENKNIKKSSIILSIVIFIFIIIFMIVLLNTLFNRNNNRNNKYTKIKKYNNGSISII